MALKKLALNLDESLIAKVDRYADGLHINRTAAICVILSMYLDGLNTMSEMSKLMKEVKKVQDEKNR